MAFIKNIEEQRDTKSQAKLTIKESQARDYRLAKV